MKRLSVVIAFLLLVVGALTSCAPNDGYPEDVYIAGDLYVWNAGTGAYDIVNGALGGGAGVPGGANTQVQYNDAGAFGGDAGLVYDDALNDLTADGSITSVNGDIVTTTGDINSGNDVNVTNDLDVTDDALIGGDLIVTGVITEGGNGVLNTSDVDDVPVNGATTDPISSNWAYDHNSAGLSSTVHPNTSICRYYAGNEAKDNWPTGKVFRIQLNTQTTDIGSNFHAATIYNQIQADNHDCSSTNIHDASASFSTIRTHSAALKYAYISWSSDAGGTINTGYGYVTAVTDASNLAIYKTNGAVFANSYYYTIKEAWYTVPVTGYYIIFGNNLFYTNIVANKTYQTVIRVVSGANATAIATSITQSSSTGALTGLIYSVTSLTAGDFVTLTGYHDTGADTVGTCGALEQYCSLSISLLTQ